MCLGFRHLLPDFPQPHITSHDGELLPGISGSYCHRQLLPDATDITPHNSFRAAALDACPADYITDTFPARSSSDRTLGTFIVSIQVCAFPALSRKHQSVPSVVNNQRPMTQITSRTNQRLLPHNFQLRSNRSWSHYSYLSHTALSAQPSTLSSRSLFSPPLSCCLTIQASRHTTHRCANCRHLEVPFLPIAQLLLDRTSFTSYACPIPHTINLLKLHLVVFYSSTISLPIHFNLCRVSLSPFVLESSPDWNPFDILLGKPQESFPFTFATSLPHPTPPTATVHHLHTLHVASRHSSCPPASSIPLSWPTHRHPPLRRPRRPSPASPRSTF